VLTGTLVGWLAGWDGREDSSVLLLGLVGVAVVGLVRVAFGAGADQLIRPVEKVQWSWRKGLVTGLVSGLLSGLAVVELAGHQTVQTPPDPWQWNWRVVGVFAGLGGGLLGGLLGGLTPGALEVTTRPNQGIHRSVRYSLLGSVVGCGLVDGLILGLYIVQAFAAGKARHGFPLAWVAGIAAEGLAYALFGALVVGWFAGGRRVFSTTRCACCSCGHTPSRGHTSRFLAPPPTIFCFAA
jgi:hypothetical protein